MKINAIIFFCLSILSSAADPLRVDIQMDQKEIYVNMPERFTITIFNDSDQPVTVARPTNLTGYFYCRAFLLCVDNPLHNQEKFNYPWKRYGCASHYNCIGLLEKYPEYYLTIPARGKIRTTIYIGTTFIDKKVNNHVNPGSGVPETYKPAFDMPGTYSINVKYYPWRDDPIILKRQDENFVFAKSLTVEVKDTTEKDKECWKKLAERRDWFLVYDAYGANHNVDWRNISPEDIDAWGELAKNHPDCRYSDLIEYQWTLMKARRNSRPYLAKESLPRLSALAADPKFIFREPAAVYEKLLKRHKVLPLPLNFFAPPFVEPTAAEIAAEKRRLAFCVAGIAVSALLLGWGSFRLWRWWKSRPKAVATMPRPKSMKFGKAGCWLAFLPWPVLFLGYICCGEDAVGAALSFGLIGEPTALVLAIVGLFKDQSKKYAIAALILGSISWFLIWIGSQPIQM